MRHHLVISVVNVCIYILYLRVVILHIRKTGELPNPAFPKTVNDKFLWRKVFDHNPDFVPLSDKLESQVIAKQKCSDVLIPKRKWVGKRACDIPDEVLTGNVMVKASHGSGFVFPVFNGTYDKQKLEKVTSRWMRRTYGKRHWEWGYFDLEPKLYVEEMILDENGGIGTTEVKLYVYSGRIEQIVMIYDRQLTSSAAVYRGDWSKSTEENKIGVPSSDRALPHNQKRIKKVVLKLCENMDHARCDLYLVGEQIWFGEYTLYNQGGYLKLKTDKKLIDAQSEAWDIRQSWYLNQKHNGIRGWYVNSLLALMQV